MKPIFFLFLFVTLFVNCKKGKTDQEKIKDYVDANHLVGSFTSSGLFVVVDQPGSGGNPTINNIVKVEYAGQLLDGTRFDATATGVPIEFPLQQVILGWQEGIPKFQKGGYGKLIIPSALGYGSSAVGKIPANSVLLFNVSLIDWR
jgi:FKBP-type peptidyl-prolyl cis-trans isomerase